MKTYYIKTFLIGLFTVLVFTSCEKVIDLNIKNTEPKVVIEAMITNELKNHEIYLSRTLNFDENTEKEGIVGAQVFVKDDLGNSFNFADHGGGVYISPRFRGFSGRTYTLTVTHQGKTYTAQSKMPLQVSINFLIQTQSTFFNETRNAIEVNYNDPIDQENYYYFRTMVNGISRNKLYVESDRFTNGKEVKNVLYFDDPELLAGDQVNVRMYTIDPKVFRYLYTIAAIEGSSGPPTAPANPDSNISSGALGYFSASTVSQVSIVLR